VPSFAEALAAKNRASLRGAERYRGFLAALRADGTGINTRVAWARSGCSYHREPLGFAGFATLRLIAKLFVVKKKLFPCGEDEVRTAIDTLQHPVLEFHCELLRPKRIAAK
jgi:hypothetical protein